MNPARLLERLSVHPTLGKLSDEDLAVIAASLEVLELPPGTVLIAEGAADRDLYLVMEGEVRMRRGALDLGHATPGELLGELALVESRPRSATVVAETLVVAARLSHPAFERIGVEEPGTALRLTLLFVRGLGRRLRSLTDDIGTLLHERSLPRRRHVNVRVDGEVREVRTGTPVGALLTVDPDAGTPVAALIDRRAVSLSTSLTADCTVDSLTTDHWEGRRIYRQSLGLMLLEAGNRVAPDVELRLDHSIGVGRRVRVVGGDEGLVERLEVEMRRLVDNDGPLHEEWWTRDEAAHYFESTGRGHVADLMRTRHEPAVRLASYGDVFVLATGPMLPTTGDLGDFGLLADGEDLVLLYGRTATGAGTPEAPDPEAAALQRAADARVVAVNAAMRQQSDHAWLGALGLSSVGQFNLRCIDGRVAQIIHVSEGSQEKRIGRIADQIAAQGSRLKVVCIAGPSSSGKTTFIKRLQVQLQVNGIQPVPLSLDDYFCDREDTPRDASGEYDFEAFEALRADLLGDHLAGMLAGSTVRTARFDFQRGRSQAAGGPELALGEHQILMLEGIHGLNPKLLDRLPDDAIFRVFVCPLQQLPLDAVSRVFASDVRLLRRIVRDRHTRGQAAADTIVRWPSVRRGERRSIFPFVSHADAVFDSSLVYELSVLKVFAQRYLLEVPSGHPATVTAYRLLGLLDDLVTIYPDYVPPTSILREFIGGSGFEY